MKKYNIRALLSLFAYIWTPLVQPQIYRKPSHEDRSVLVILYMAARNDLAMYAETHLRQLLDLGSSHRVKIFAHLALQKPGEPYITKNFFIEKNRLIPVGPEKATDSGRKETLVNAAKIAYNEFPADDVVLVLWNHGTGPIEPQVTPLINQWELWHIDEDTGKINLDQSVGYIERFAPGETSFHETKGICFDDATGHFLSIADLNEAIEYIARSIIHKKLSIVACDACLMAGADVFLGMHPYVNYFVASQEVELGLGYKYDLIVEPLVQDRICCGEELACHFVESFQKYYSPKIDFYTHAAIDLSYSEQLEENIDKLARTLSYGLEKQKDKTIKEAIRLSRHKKYCVRFNEPTYIDLGNFYSNLLKNIDLCELTNADETLTYKKNLYDIAQEGIDLIKQSVKANVVGSKHKKASGISIYFPEFIIHKSYATNIFAQKTYWFSFLEKYVASR